MTPRYAQTFEPEDQEPPRMDPEQKPNKSESQGSKHQNGHTCPWRKKQNRTHGANGNMGPKPENLKAPKQRNSGKKSNSSIL